MKKGHYHVIMPRSLSHDDALFKLFNQIYIIVTHVDGIVDKFTTPGE